MAEASSFIISLAALTNQAKNEQTDCSRLQFDIWRAPAAAAHLRLNCESGLAKIHGFNGKRK